jgi:hypothetical protein
VEGGRATKADENADQGPAPGRLARNEYDIVACLKRSILPCRDRNLLAHGNWWEFDIDTSAIKVRSGIARAGQDQHRVLTLADIQKATDTLDDVEFELYRIQSAIEERPQPARPKPARSGSIIAFWCWLITLIRRP